MSSRTTPLSATVIQAMSETGVNDDSTPETSLVLYSVTVDGCASPGCHEDLGVGRRRFHGGEGSASCGLSEGSSQSQSLPSSLAPRLFAACSRPAATTFAISSASVHCLFAPRPRPRPRGLFLGLAPPRGTGGGKATPVRLGHLCARWLLPNQSSH